MAEAKDQAMWFGVDDGVRRYDGFHWTAYTQTEGLLGAPVNALCATRDGGVYAGTEAGISRFHEGRWQRVFPPEGDPSTRSTGSGQAGSGQALPWPVDDLTEARDGGLWAGTGWGALHLSREGATLHTTREMGDVLRGLALYVRLSLVPDEAAPIRSWSSWVGAGARVVEGGMMSMRTPQTPAVWAVAPGGPGAEAGLRVGDRLLSVNGQRVAWANDALTGAEGDTSRLRVRREGASNPVEMTVALRRAEGTYREFPVYDVCEGRDGTMWFGLQNGEVVHYRPGGAGAWRLYTNQDGMETGWGPHIAQPRDGAVWVVSDDGRRGVSRFDPSTTGSASLRPPLRASGKQWTHFRLGDLGGTNINTSILETRDGTLWVGGFALHFFRDGRWRTHSALGIPWHRQRLLETSDGALWVAGLGQEAVRLDYGASEWTTCEGLWFQCDTPDGAKWFLSQDSSVVRYDGRAWVRYGVEDGLMEAPVAILATRGGDVWAAGSHQGAAATARLKGDRWSLRTHLPAGEVKLTYGVIEALDGSLWFGFGEVNGLLQFDPSAGSGQAAWTRHTPPMSPEGHYMIGQTGDGALWVGGFFGLRRFDGRAWTVVAEPEGVASYIHAVHGTEKGDLWVGTRTYGVFHFDGRTWRQHDEREGLANNQVNAVLRASDGSVWVATNGGVSRFDGRTWVAHALPRELKALVAGDGLRQSRDGALWFNMANDFRTIRHEPHASPPETEIAVSLDRVSQPGNTVLAWRGMDPWRVTPDEELQYAWRLDGGAWSPFSFEKNRVFLSLPGGGHVFEVKARDRDFNEDPTPAVVRFRVVPPVWQEPWFIGMVALLLGVVGLQTGRVVRRDRRLRESNAALSSANRGLFQANEDLKREIAERQRTEGERARLDERLQQLRYLYRMRSSLGDARSPEEAIRRAGEALVEVLPPSAGALIQYKGRTWQFWGTKNAECRMPNVEMENPNDPHSKFEIRNSKLGGVRYDRGLFWGGRERGRLSLFCDVALSESQERTLLDETAGQIAAVMEARELETQILHSSRLVSLGQMAAGVAHELSQPLSAISATAEGLFLRLEEGIAISRRRTMEMMGHVMGLVERMIGTIEHLRVFSRDTSGEAGVRFSVNEVVRSSLGLVGAQLRSHGVTLRLNLGEGLPPVWGHPHQMEQVLMNLLNNARDALDEKETGDRRQETGDGENRICSTAIYRREVEWEKRLTIRTQRETYGGSRWVVAEVEDNGAGIDEAHRARLFEPFFTTKPADRGTGIGLSICQAIVQKHGGWIACESRKGEGTTFRVGLPAAEET